MKGKRREKLKEAQLIFFLCTSQTQNLGTEENGSEGRETEGKEERDIGALRRVARPNYLTIWGFHNLLILHRRVPGLSEGLEGYSRRRNCSACTGIDRRVRRICMRRTVWYADVRTVFLLHPFGRQLRQGCPASSITSARVRTGSYISSENDTSKRPRSDGKARRSSPTLKASRVFSLQQAPGSSRTSAG